jgi:hypothetical protein
LYRLQNTHQERLKGLREKLQGEKEALGLHQQTTLTGLQQQVNGAREGRVHVIFCMKSVYFHV